IAIKGKPQEAAKASPGNIRDLKSDQAVVSTWMDIGQKQYSNATSEVLWSALPYQVFGAEWIKFPKDEKVSGSFSVDKKSVVYVLSTADSLNTTSWMADFSKIEGLATNTDNINYNVYVDTLSQGQSLEFEGLRSEDVSLAVVPYYEMGDGESKRPSV